jgi:hypothetical protein
LHDYQIDFDHPFKLSNPEIRNLVKNLFIKAKEEVWNKNIISHKGVSSLFEETDMMQMLAEGKFTS